MLYRCMEERDRPGITALWQAVFGDDAAFINACIDGFAHPHNVFVAADDGRVAAQLLAAPCAVGDAAGFYFYALATQPALRGQGVMAALMRFAEGQLAVRGGCFAVLIPASDSLFGYYRPKGYTAELLLRHLTFGPPFAAGAEDVQNAPPDAKVLRRLRQSFLGTPFVDFEGGAEAVIVQDLAAAGAQLATADGAYAVWLRRGEALFMAELGAQSDARANALLGALCQKMGCGAVHATLPAQGGPYAGKGDARPVALLKPLGAWRPPPGLYLRFALDEL